MSRRALAVAVGTLLVACGPDDPGRRPGLSLVETLAGPDRAGYARALAPRPFDFPADQGPHPRFRTEWWYLTGNLSASGGAEYGFQLTFFRSALAPIEPAVDSRWGTNQAYMAHFTVTDIDAGAFHAHERFARGAVGLAGASSPPLRVWVEDWVIEAESAGVFPLRVHAAESGVAIDLRLEEGKPVVLQGDRGLSAKGPERGNASYYYSYTRLPAVGSITLGSDTVRVSGDAWLDREWSTSALGEGLVGWDWLALRLDDGWEMMVYRLRREDGSADPFSDGVLVDPTGRTVALDWGRDLAVEETASWASPVDGAVYPAGWRIRVPERGWDLRVAPLVADQELDLAFRYWEGAVRVEGTGEAGAPVSGRGYVELTGYGDATPRGR